MRRLSFYSFNSCTKTHQSIRGERKRSRCSLFSPISETLSATYLGAADSQNPWEQDSIEIFVDQDHNRTTTASIASTSQMREPSTIVQADRPSTPSRA
ncbi:MULTISPECIES: sugar-binding protein [unclassified Paenibacillus]|uniref:sugar-binding protein n=1 Tax=unclassified Paenibacillus TaxID=185978 RepID=UPI001910DA05